MSFRDWLSGPVAKAKVANPANDGGTRSETLATLATLALADPKETKSDANHEAFEERAAIYEYEAGFTRGEAERRATR